MLKYKSYRNELIFFCSNIYDFSVKMLPVLLESYWTLLIRGDHFCRWKPRFSFSFFFEICSKHSDKSKDHLNSSTLSMTSFGTRFYIWGASDVRVTAPDKVLFLFRLCNLESFLKTFYMISDALSFFTLKTVTAKVYILRWCMLTELSFA